MENMGSDTASQSGSPEQLPLVFTPAAESRLDHWQQTGSFPYPDLNVFPQPVAHEYSKTDLRLIHHISYISNDLHLNNSNNLTLWTQKMPKSVHTRNESRMLVSTRSSHFANKLCPLDSSALLPRIHTLCTLYCLSPRTTLLGHNHRQRHEICRSIMALSRCAAFMKPLAAFRLLMPMRFWPRRYSCFGKQRTGKFGRSWIEKQN